MTVVCCVACLLSLDSQFLYILYSDCLFQSGLPAYEPYFALNPCSFLASGSLVLLLALMILAYGLLSLTQGSPYLILTEGFCKALWGRGEDKVLEY